MTQPAITTRVAPDRRIIAGANPYAGAENAARAVARHIPDFSPDQTFQLASAIGEILDNALTHSGAARAILKLTADESYITVSVSDRGCGIPAAMRLNPSIANQPSDQILLLSATNPGTTSTGSPERGQGLHHVVRYAKNNGLSLLVRSAKATMQIATTGSTSSRSESKHRSGTLVKLTIPIPPPAQEE